MVVLAWTGSHSLQEDAGLVVGLAGSQMLHVDEEVFVVGFAGSQLPQIEVVLLLGLAELVPSHVAQVEP